MLEPPRPLRAAAIALLVLVPLASARLVAAPVDYPTQIQPILSASCGEGFCHIDRETSGVELTSYETTLASFGLQYDRNVVVPFDAAQSPLWLKISQADPEFGDRMPDDLPPLAEDQISLIARWINEGARPATVSSSRGDVDRNGSIDITDPIRVLGFLFLGDPPPPCLPAVNANADQGIDLSDAIFLLGFLFRGGPAPLPLTPEEAIACTTINRPPVGQPLGTILGREGLPLVATISASDPDGDALRFLLESGPDGLAVEGSSGDLQWTPRFGQAGDHRVRVRVEEATGERLSAIVTGLVRVLDGNHPPAVDPPGNRFGREGVLLIITVAATDLEGDQISFSLLEGPATSSLDATSGLFHWLPPAGSAGEHEVRIQVADDGEPPQSTGVTLRLTIVSANSPVNQPPFLPDLDVYRTAPERQILRPVGAVDPDGDALSFVAHDLPAGATLHPTTGILSWLPTAAQVGAHYIPFSVTDSGTPPATVDGVLIFRIEPQDDCSILICDPATGCERDVKPVTQACCAAGPTARVPEPNAPCPGGRVLHIGRNARGFGRMQNCDKLRIVAFAQGGESVGFHLETRCVNAQREASVTVILETVDEVLVDRERLIFLQERADGFAQRLNLVFAVDTLVPHSELEGEEALLTVRLTDFDGVVIVERLRVTLTLQDLPDLPEPDVQDVPASEAGCIGCHRPIGPTGQRHGTEDAHPWYPLSCTDCHGGDPAANTRAEAHVFPPFGDPLYLRNLSYDQLNAADPDYLQFINPGDSRVARRGCGAANPAAGGTGCHQTQVDNMPLSVMSTYVGHYSLPRFLTGMQDRAPEYAAVDVVDPDFDPGSAPPGAVQSLAALREPDPLLDRATLAACMDVYLPKSCPTCHLSDFGRNNATANYRSSGCTACHMVYDDDGLSKSDDPMVSKDFPPHPARHQLTTAIPTEQCAHCHFQGGRIGLAYRGIREGGFSAARTPPNAVPLGREIHDHDARYYFTDEDDTNDFDETPPDVHHQAGMVCADCHVGADVHGDGNLYAGERYQVGIRCEDCHGTVRAEAQEDIADGKFKTSRGSTLARLRRTAENKVMLRLLTGDRELEVPQIHRIVASGVNQAMIEAMGVNEHGFSHTDKLECYTCHTSWRLTCFGCHVTIDDTRLAPNRTTGQSSLGAIAVSRDDYSIDFFALGVNRSGKISPLCSSMSVYMSYIDPSGVLRFQDQVRTSADGRLGFGWNPFHHHTVSRVPQNCDRCHPVAAGAGPDNTANLRETYGFGNGRFRSRDGAGVERDLSAFLDEAGELDGEFPHPGTGPVPREVRERAMSLPVVPHPRQ